MRDERRDHRQGVGGLTEALLDDLARNPQGRWALAATLGLAGSSSEPAWMDAAEKAAQLRLTPEVLQRMAREGRIPGARKAGRRWLFPAASVEVLPRSPQTPPDHADRPRRPAGRPESAGTAALRQRAQRSVSH